MTETQLGAIAPAWSSTAVLILAHLMAALGARRTAMTCCNRSTSILRRKPEMVFGINAT
jgi:hypothetical protein